MTSGTSITIEHNGDGYLMNDNEYARRIHGDKEIDLELTNRWTVLSNVSYSVTLTNGEDTPYNGTNGCVLTTP